MTHHFTPEQIKAIEIARNWLIAIVIGLAFCIATANDQCTADLDKQSAYEAQQQAGQDALIDAKARQIALSMMESSNGK